MLYIKEHQIRKILDMINGRIPEDAVLQDMKAFFKEEFGINIFDYICERAKTGLLRMRIVVWDGKDMRPFFCRPDRELENMIKDRFSRACREHGLNTEYYDPKDYFSVVTPLKHEVEQMLMNKEMMDKISALLRTFPEVKSHRFSIPTVHVFYETDADIENYEKSGLSTKIRDAISDLLGSLPGLEGRKMGDVRFSSLEEFEGRYKGNFYGFWLDH